MRLIDGTILCFIALAVRGCERNAPIPRAERIEQQIVNDFKQRTTFFREFETIVGTAQMKLYSERLKDGETFMELSGLLHDRYILIMVVGIKVDKKTHTVDRYEQPTINLEEIVSVSGSATGPLSIKHGQTLRISPRQWQMLADNKGDFSISASHW